MDTLTNPQLGYMTQVVLADGRHGMICDKASHLRTRQIDICGEVSVQKLHVKQIDTAYTFGIWYKCRWD